MNTDKKQMKGFKVRLLPTEEQEKNLWLNASAARFSWNWGLGFQMERFKNGEPFLSAYELRKHLFSLKSSDENFYWLNEVSSKAIAFAILDLGAAYKRFFAIQKKGKKFSDNKRKYAARNGKSLTHYDMIGHPKFKKKGLVTPSFGQPNEMLYFTDGCAVLLKVGRVKVQTNLTFPQGRTSGKYYNPRVSYVNGKWILSFSMEVENQDYALNDYSVGVDLGIKTLATVSCNGEKLVFPNINKTSKVKSIKKQLKKVQRKFSKRKKGSANKRKVYDRMRALYYKLSNIRKDHTHKTTRKVVDLLPSRIVIEDLSVSGMMKNRHLSKAISEQTFYEFRRQLEYKCSARGIELVIADRFFPSSKRCSCCGAILKTLTLKDRVFNCPSCGLSIDRDFNAALNLESYTGK